MCNIDNTLVTCYVASDRGYAGGPTRLPSVIVSSFMMQPVKKVNNVEDLK